MADGIDTYQLDTNDHIGSRESSRIYPRHTFLFGQKVKQGWTTINDLTFELYDNGLINVKMDVYISRPQHIRFYDIGLIDNQNVNLVGGIELPTFSYPTEDDVYLPGQAKSVVDRRIIPALQYLTRMTGKYDIWG